MRVIYLLLSLLCFSITALANNPFSTVLNKPSLLPPEEAFTIQVMEVSDQDITLDVHITPGYYLYRDQFSFTPDEHLTLGPITLPMGVSVTDEFFGTQQVYKENTLIKLPVEQHAAEAMLHVSYRGCAPVGVCYPPMEKTLTLAFKESTAANTTEHAQATTILAERHFILALLIFFGLGILLALTPCVLPMIPILSSIILGQKNISRARAFELSFIYVIATALTFAIAGVVAALLGASLQSSLQQPWVMMLSAAILIILALLLLLDYPLQLPQKMHNKLDFLGRQQKSGTLLGVAGMGVFSALVVSPCVTPPLIGALIYIAESGNVWLGGGALFMLGLGMGVPLIGFAVFGIHMLPKQGPWLRGIKIIFAVLLIGLAISLITRILPNDLNSDHATSAPPTFDYILVKNLDDLNQQLAEAKAQKQAVILDFYATWCVSCVKMEKTVFPDPTVQALLHSVRFLKADVSENDAEDQALQQQFGVYGPPALIFFSPEGLEQHDFQWVGEINAEDFTHYLEKWLATHPNPS